MKLAWRIVGLLVGALFVFAGLTKIVDFQPFRVVDPMEFARAIDNYKILPWSMSVWLSFYLPWLEIICGLALIFRRFYSGALTLVLALMLVFIGGSVAAKARGIDISCGCFGHVSDQLSFAWHMVLDFAILAGLVALWRWDGVNPRVAEQASPVCAPRDDISERLPPQKITNP
jgi:putative oxidoreductase